MLTNNIASRAVVSERARGAFFGAVDAEGRMAGLTGVGAVAPWPLKARPGVPAGISAIGMRELGVVTAHLAKTSLGQTTVRTQHTYNFTRVMTTGDGTPGPPRGRLPD